MMTQRRRSSAKSATCRCRKPPTTLAWKHFKDSKLGTVFGGVPQVGITIDQLLAMEGKL